jgi:transglutaminase-like putative cysteine protease
VRDGLRYDPYSVELAPNGLVASNVLARGRGYCVAKAGVLAATARAIGIPSRLGFADVRNHLATPRLLEMMGTDVFYYHGFTELLLEHRWVKATPAFNVQLCERFGVEPLEFDGRNDSIFHPYDTGGRRHMEYVNDRGTRDDMPIEELREAMARFYPQMILTPPGGDFHAEAAAVSRGNTGGR